MSENQKKEVNLSQKLTDEITPRFSIKKNKINGVKKIIAISSAKGGVGKSTVATNIAIAIKKLGFKTGILDADVYGPSIPLMMGVDEKPISEDGVKLIPIKKFDIDLISIGLLVSENTPMIWRGPMVASTVKTFTNKVIWNDLDFLIIDMPPGTGDALLTFSQEIDINGVVIVTTPQKIALADVRRGIEMFKKINVKILGIIENMSKLTLEDTDHFIFGKDGGKDMAKKFQIDFLGDIEINENLRKSSDDGVPYVEKFDDHFSKNFMSIADKIIKRVN
ncbi:MAG: Mrp/NBP35 family ATP-binding protein [Pelagibacterales bacterium]|nr:Mrp/NBP35 family ATP-binding protein [Pelagibacterales bacterium]